MTSAGKFFDGFAETFDTFYDGKRNRLMRWIDQRFRRDMFARFTRTFDLLGNLNGARVIDIGCGSGPYVAELLKRGALHVTAMDAAPAMLRMAEQRVAYLGMRDRVEFVEGCFPQICPQGPFDFAIVMGVLDYVEDPLSFLRGLRSIVTGRAVLSWPSVHWFRTPFRKLRYELRRCPVYFYTRDRIETLVREVGVSHCHLEKIPGAGLDYVSCLSV